MPKAKENGVERIVVCAPIKIGNNNRGKRLKDVTKIENITKDMASQYGNNPTYVFLRDASMNIIPETTEKVNTLMKKHYGLQQE